jgi:hypothetical protein
MSTEFAKTNKTPSIPSPGGDASRSVPRVDPVVLRGSPPSSHEEGYDKTGHLFQNELTPQQEIAVEMMMDGKTDLEISKKLKMRRQTINEWRNHNMDFIFELQLRRSQVWEKQRDKMSHAVDKAFDILIKNLDNKDEKIRLAVAMQLVRMTGVQENLKNKTPMDAKTIEDNKYKAALHQALEEVTKEMGFS